MKLTDSQKPVLESNGEWLRGDLRELSSMESLVLCPEELCLGPLRTSSSPDLSIWTNVDVEKGTKFWPWKGTVRSDKLPMFEKLPEFDIRHRYGLYEEITEVTPGRGFRQCNWIRFIRYSLVYNEEVNLLGTKNSKGEPVYELIKDLEPKVELVCFFVPERPEESFILPAIHYLRHTLFKRLIDSALEESPLDLSTSLVSKVFPLSPANSEGQKSISSESTVSTSDSESLVRSPILSAVDVLKAVAQRTQQQQTESLLPPPPPPIAPPKPPVVRRREKKELPCHYCGKAFDRPSLLKRHIRIHTGERPHVCDICSKGFSTSSSLNTHRRIHSGEKPHQCGVCGKCFTASSNLYYHKMTHVKEKPHKCTMCSKSFPTPGDLKSHTYVHTGTWPFKCHICHRGFSKQTNLKNHLLLHSGDKPFSCDICQKKFALSCNLRAHLKTHEAEYQSSATSLALYQRALAVLGSAGSGNHEEDSPSATAHSGSSPIASGDEEAEEEEISIKETNNNKESIFNNKLSLAAV